MFCLTWYSLVPLDFNFCLTLYCLLLLKSKKYFLCLTLYWLVLLKNKKYALSDPTLTRTTWNIFCLSLYCLVLLKKYFSCRTSYTLTRFTWFCFVFHQIFSAWRYTDSHHLIPWAFPPHFFLLSSFFVHNLAKPLLTHSLRALERENCVCRCSTLFPLWIFFLFFNILLSRLLLSNVKQRGREIFAAPPLLRKLDKWNSLTFFARHFNLLSFIFLIIFQCFFCPLFIYLFILFIYCLVKKYLKKKNAIFKQSFFFLFAQNCFASPLLRALSFFGRFVKKECCNLLTLHVNFFNKTTKKRKTNKQ